MTNFLQNNMDHFSFQQYTLLINNYSSLLHSQFLPIFTWGEERKSEFFDQEKKLLLPSESLIINNMAAICYELC